MISFIGTGPGGNAEEMNDKELEIFKMLKMVGGKHHVASNNITYSMDKNVTFNRSFHFTAFYPVGPVRYATAPLHLSPAQNDIFHITQVVWANETWSFGTKWQGYIKVCFWRPFSCLSLLVLKKSAKIGQFWNFLKTLDGVCAPIFLEVRFFDARSYSTAQNAVYWMVRARIFEKKCKNGSA